AAAGAEQKARRRVERDAREPRAGGRAPGVRRTAPEQAEGAEQPGRADPVEGFPRSAQEDAGRARDHGQEAAREQSAAVARAEPADAEQPAAHDRPDEEAARGGEAPFARPARR